ncbi:nucleotide exchange factor GrpE [Cyanobacteria bacterium FACHB-DQ100]|uniref:nucleotide exchange factor GrpE n=1 Tax=unclassified Leptolyngbya TaxID=2650499 RepID=UPI00168140F6|nr:nucleotide exchange factor GrpE [Leptolyngbya sp. FACHB-17]MBD1822565.1 nucleotide exchange factor GrpE [Cyanobacteria bacterium FACHB-DQ100]MBD2082313.1 nucleotide exchange factor GrpE [Leptolyngbya sp. FACHB-17]
MIDEQNQQQQPDEVQAPVSESSDPLSEPASDAVETNSGVEGSTDQDTTDYEAAFMELRSNYAAKEREIEGLKKQAEELNNQYMRIAADFENFRRRTQREREELETQIKCNTVKELLPVVDNFERARSQIKPQTESESNIHKSYQGVYKDMVDRLKKVGVAPMRAEGKEFDPNLHEAVMRQPTSEHPEGTVVEELMRGYTLDDKVLRHAMVKVAAPPEDESTSQS